MTSTTSASTSPATNAPATEGSSTRATEGEAAASAPPPPPSISDLITRAQTMVGAESAAARDALQTIAQEQPQNPVAQLGWGIVLGMVGKLDEAGEYFAKAAAIEPKFASAWTNLGNIHKLKGRFKDAQAAYRKAIALAPDLADAHYNLALVLEMLNDSTEAEESLRRAILFKPNYAEAHNNLGHLRLKAGKVEQAVSFFRQALVFQPAMRMARDNLIFALYRLGRTVEAQSEIDKLLAECPDDPQVLRVQAAGLAQMGRMEDAADINRKLMELEPDAADLQLNMAEVLLSRNDYEGAMACYRELLAKRNVPPATAIGAMANVMHSQGNYSEARAIYQQALLLAPNAAQLLLGLARALLDAGEVRLGLETMRRVLQLGPKMADVHSLLIHSMQLDPTVTHVQRSDEAQKWTAQHTAKVQLMRAHPRALRPKEALRLAFLVGDLERGPEGVALQSLLATLPKQEFDVFVYHCGRSGVRCKSLQENAPHWRPVAALGNADLAEQIRQDGIDVLVDAIGHGPGSRLQALAEHPAAWQLGWMGESAPAEVAAINARLTDAVLDASVLAAAEPDATLVPLKAPWFWPKPDYADDAAIANTPAPDAFVFGVMAPLAQISAPALDAWSEILLAVPDAHLTILTDLAPGDTGSRERLARLLRVREIDETRFDILPKMPADERNTAIRVMSMVLDTFPKPMGFEALDCVWQGVPVLTLAGAEPWQCTTASVLAQGGVAYWVANNSANYVRQAVDFTNAPHDRDGLRARLQTALQASSLMDAAAFTSSFVAAVRCVRGDAPA